MDLLALVVGWILAIFVGLLGLVVLYLIFIGRINLEKLISEPDGDASLSRFQFLIFTFVIAMSLFFIVVRSNDFPNIPAEVIGLLGISGGSYIISKAIQKGGAEKEHPTDNEGGK